MRVPTQTQCPECPRPARVHFDTEKQNYDCGNGHTFAEDPATLAPVSKSRTPEPVAVEAKPAERGAVLAPPPGPVVIGADVSPVAPPSASVVAVDPPPAVEPAAVPGVCVAPAPPPSGGFVDLLAQQTPVRCANGDWLVVVRVPELHALTLIAEAEGQRRTFGEYFQRAVNFGLEQDWFRNAGN